jgi:hypothetical protein
MKLKLPAVVKVFDYHEFDNMPTLFKQMGLKVKVKEVAFIQGEYVGIVYTGRLADAKNRSLVNTLKREEAADEPWWT